MLGFSSRSEFFKITAEFFTATRQLAMRSSLTQGSIGRARTKRRLTKRSRRSGAVYVVVLMSSLIVASLTIAALTSARMHSLGKSADSDSRLAQVGAEACIEWALANINADSNWRTSHTNNTDIASIRLGDTSLTYRLIDEDGNLADDASDSCELVVTARTNQAANAYRVSLTPTGPALNCLNFAIASVGNVLPAGLAAWGTEQAVASEGNITVNGNGMLVADCYAGGTITGPYYGTANALAGSLEVPSVDVLATYEDMATVIDIATLPLISSEVTIENQLLTATENTITGTVNPDGIYMIDCGGQRLVIKNSRLQCTLIVRNTNPEVRIESGVFWESPLPNYPVILAEGQLDLETYRSTVSEVDTGVNFNPPSVPYRGVSDSTTDTVYPTQIRGLVYASGDLEIGNVFTANEVHGLIICGGQLRGSGDLTVHYSELFAIDPPPGFQQGSQMAVVPGSIARCQIP